MWWFKGNTLALVELMVNESRSLDGSTEATLNSHLIGAARAMGIPEEKIREAFDAEDFPVIYYP